MSEKMNLWQRLHAIKKEVRYIKKDKQGFNYSYATPEAVLGEFNPLLNKFGVILKSEVVEESHERMTYETKRGEKTETHYTLKMRFTWINVDKPEEREEVLWGASGINGEEKGFGSALTYAERYFILKQFNVPTGEDDPDRFQEKHRGVEPAPKKPAPKKKPAPIKKAANDFEQKARVDFWALIESGDLIWKNGSKEGVKKLILGDKGPEQHYKLIKWFLFWLGNGVEEQMEHFLKAASGKEMTLTSELEPAKDDPDSADLLKKIYENLKPEVKSWIRNDSAA